MGAMATECSNHAARKINRSNLLRRPVVRKRQSNLQIRASSWQTKNVRRTTQNHERSRLTNRLELTSIRQQTHQTRIHRKRIPTTAPMERTRPNASSQIAIQIPKQQTRLRRPKTRRRRQSPTLRLPTLAGLHGRQQQSLERNEGIPNPRRQLIVRPLRHPASMDQQPPKQLNTRRIQLHQLRKHRPKQRRHQTPSNRQSPTLPMHQLRQTPNKQHLHPTQPSTNKIRQITI